MICETFSTEQGRRGRQDSAVARNACHHQHGPFFPGVLGFGSFSFQKRGVAYYSLKLSANVSGLHGCRGIARGQDIPYMACILSTLIRSGQRRKVSRFGYTWRYIGRILSEERRYPILLLVPAQGPKRLLLYT